ncbi:MAG: 2-oxoacid:ferredoxin oxidoreductase subunit beta [Deltaproteobacteria bacterium]|nr:2-oxoacid:ferredoxin oxidoreductase subunit beta [Deltaproteobacteria bacterium]
MIEPVNEIERGVTRKNYLSSIAPRWCPGCGSHALFKSLTDAFAELKIPNEKLAVISGIGCSSRSPYYVESYGFHSIHGRAPAVAQGVKLANPELSVWITTGDGDALAIGGNHFTHLMRRNPNIKLILFNNEIYGLTKGQASPTSYVGQKTKTTKFGNIERPVRPLSQAISSGATFAARLADTDGAQMTRVMVEAGKHKGVSFIEVLINCVIYADGVWEQVSSKQYKPENTIRLEHGKPMLFGVSSEKGIVLEGLRPKVVKIGENGITKENILVHDIHNPNLSYILANMTFPEFPMPLGIFQQLEQPCYDDLMQDQAQSVTAKLGEGDIFKLLKSGDIWRIDENGTVHSA